MARHQRSLTGQSVKWRQVQKHLAQPWISSPFCTQGSTNHPAKSSVKVGSDPSRPPFGPGPCSTAEMFSRSFIGPHSSPSQQPLTRCSVPITQDQTHVRPRSGTSTITCWSARRGRSSREEHGSSSKQVSPAEASTGTFSSAEITPAPKALGIPAPGSPKGSTGDWSGLTKVCGWSRRLREQRPCKHREDAQSQALMGAETSTRESMAASLLSSDASAKAQRRS